MEATEHPTIFQASLDPDRPSPTDAAAQSGELAHLGARITQLEEALAARDDLIRLVGHELRNPLSPVFLQAHHLMAEVSRPAGPGAVSTEWLIPRLEVFLRGLHRLLDRMNRLMDVAALQSSGGIVLVPDEVDLAEIAGGVVLSLAGEASAAGTAIDLGAPAPVIGHWDPVRLEQILLNLISNAIRYGAGSPIQVEVRAMSDDTAGLVVRDHGPGIAEEVRPHLFERLERPGPRAHPGGLGLGLWIVHRLCGAMGGSVTVDSEPGGGAAFAVILPRGSISPDPTAVDPNSISGDAVSP